MNTDNSLRVRRVMEIYFSVVQDRTVQCSQMSLNYMVEYMGTDSLAHLYQEPLSDEVLHYQQCSAIDWVAPNSDAMEGILPTPEQNCHLPTKFRVGDENKINPKFI